MIHPCEPVWKNPKGASGSEHVTRWRCTVPDCGFDSTDGEAVREHIWHDEPGVRGSIASARLALETKDSPA